MRISILGSGSSGNCTFVDAEGAKILIDAGFSCKKIEEKLLEIGESLENIAGIFITHEHGDHIMGAGIISRKYDIPIYVARESYEVAAHKFGKIAEENLRFIEETIYLDGAVEVIPFDVMHDAVRTLGYRIHSTSGRRAAISTDIGYADNTVKEHFRDVDVMVIECNYDYYMLMNGPYPWDLKARVKSRNGHLSNNDAAKLIRDSYSERLKKAFLVHVSKDSNKYELAMETVAKELKANSIDLELEVATQNELSSIFEV